MNLPLYQVDAFANRTFSGNPAAVCPLTEWLPREQMQQIAAENNLSETAFFVAQGEDFAIRWFTPTDEVDLCGHATLASAFVVLEMFERERERVTFHSKSGPLVVRRQHHLLVMDFPADVPEASPPLPEIGRALGAEPRELHKAQYWLAVFDSQDDVRRLEPDMRALAELKTPVVATATGTNVDFVSRFFGPGLGVDEDPVTGSAHCILTPFWAKRLEKRTMSARQISARGGELRCEDHGERVHIAGRAVLYLSGTIHLPD